MRGLVAAAVLMLAAGCGGRDPARDGGSPPGGGPAGEPARIPVEPERPAGSLASAGTPRVFTGKVVPHPDPTGQPASRPRGLALVTDDGNTYPIVEDDTSRMLFVDARLRGRPVALTAVPAAGTGGLQVVYVQTVHDGVVYDVDYWCEICQISANHPGPCVCCGDDSPLRERPAR
jgi:hypothetical protein